ncbi:hypothetical protein EVAR_14437_1 [Eumeta japonica]|uniref:Uncharacterized protein n=1 Tax=Eumeta variegata TaxID=151549 RepID=A0A4C1TXC8_EUMVA|nr:hypothetical protein EVAR_14437_1 [Eumeta japonica]
MRGSIRPITSSQTNYQAIYAGGAVGKGRYGKQSNSGDSRNRIRAGSFPNGMFRKLATHVSPVGRRRRWRDPIYAHMVFLLIIIRESVETKPQTGASYIPSTAARWLYLTHPAIFILVYTASPLPAGAFLFTMHRKFSKRDCLRFEKWPKTRVKLAFFFSPSVPFDDVESHRSIDD